MKKKVENEIDDYGDEIKREDINILSIISLFAMIIGTSWILTCGALNIIAEWFDIEFDIFIATGIWLILWLLRSVLKK